MGNILTKMRTIVYPTLQYRKVWANFVVAARLRKPLRRAWTELKQLVVYKHMVM